MGRTSGKELRGAAPGIGSEWVPRSSSHASWRRDCWAAGWLPGSPPSGRTRRRRRPAGKATHGRLGLSVQDKTSGASSDFTAGAEVATVTSGSAADKAGLKAGDVVTGLAGRTVTDASELTAAPREQAAGATVKITFQRWPGTHREHHAGRGVLRRAAVPDPIGEQAKSYRDGISRNCLGWKCGAHSRTINIGKLH
ncbi:PDZ domain-containing protein [Arthrobacter sp. OAP107]|uniref:PDZ domain-containing protein n=1 Tax=Arthrobacter sp. OAP107 TaxID=3156445 RepID=UPI003395196E